MTDKIYALILAAIFILHNIEEYLSFDKMPKISLMNLLGKKIVTRHSFLFAITFLSFFVLAIGALNYLSENPIFYQINILVLFSLAINALQHLILSLKERRIMPGTLTAALLILPCSILYTMKLFESSKLDSWSFLKYALLSPIVMFISIYISLWLGYLLTKSTYKKGD